MRPIIVGLTFAVLQIYCVEACAQLVESPNVSRDFVIEVTYRKGMPLSFQPIGNWAWYGAFALTEDWKAKMGQKEIRAVKLHPREEKDSVKVKVTVLRGINHEIEDLVGEYRLAEKTLIVAELLNFGIVPFELRLVRAPATVAELPATTSAAKSLLVGVEPLTANLPSFKATFTNSSAKPVLGIAIRTTINGKPQYSAMPRGRYGNALIAPGQTYERTLRFPTKLVQASTGEVPQTKETGLQLEVQAVVFSDGTWEGNQLQASQLRAFILGEKIQVGRILALLRSPAAESPPSLANALDGLSYQVDLAQVDSLVTEFPGLPKSAPEFLREATQAATSGIHQDFKAAFGKGSIIDPSAFPAIVRREIVKVQAWFDSLP